MQPAKARETVTGICLILSTLFLAACGAESADQAELTSDEAALVASAASDSFAEAERGTRGLQRLKVMTFNIFYGGDDLDLTTGDFCAVADGCEATFQQVINTIRAADADIIGVQEPERNVARIGRELGFYYSERDHVVSRYPIIDPPDGDGIVVYVEIRPGKVVAMANVHLPSDPYGPYLVRDGGSKKKLLALEQSVRMPAIQRQLDVLPRLAKRGMPVFLSGDFNSPSHLDWTAAVSRVRADVKFPFSWPVSSALASSGFYDSYRAVHPNPVQTPGFTWTPGGPESAEQEVFDRIDWVLSAGPSRAIASRIVGEVGGPDVDIEMSPYPSDHRALVSTFEVRPTEPPVLVAVSSRRVFIGSSLALTFHSPGRPGETLALARVRADGEVALRPMLTKPTPGDAKDGVVEFRTSTLQAGEYRARLLDDDGEVLSETPFWAYPSDEPTTLALSAARYRVGQPITTHVHNAPGRGLDWLAVYRCGKNGCDPNSDYLMYAYTGAQIEGNTIIDANSISGAESWPLAPGRYVVRLLTDDSYVDLATSAEFTVVR
jgi:endonuclease/exonuclease/phosphatase family metal-dependent hydrolase